MKFATSYLFVIGIVGGLLSGIFIDRFVKKTGLKKGRLISISAFGLMSMLFIVTATTPSKIVASACLMGCYILVPINGVNYFSACVDIGNCGGATYAESAPVITARRPETRVKLYTISVRNPAQGPFYFAVQHGCG